MARTGKKISRSYYGDAGIAIVLTLFGAFMILPFVYTIVQSIKPIEELFRFPPRFFVTNPTGENFYMLTQLTNNLWVPFGRYLINSVSITVIGTFLHVVFASMAAFPLAKFRFTGSKVFFEIVVLALLFAGPVTAVPLYVIMARLGFINTYWALILPPIAMPLGLFLMKNFMMQIPDELLEAGKMDGCSVYGMYWRIAMPNVRPAWLTLVIFSFQGIWNSGGIGVTYIYEEALKVLPTVLNQIVASGMARAGVGAAAAVVMLVPPVVTFVIVQSNVLETMAHSGIKA